MFFSPGWVERSFKHSWVCVSVCSFFIFCIGLAQRLFNSKQWEIHTFVYIFAFLPTKCQRKKLSFVHNILFVRERKNIFVCTIDPKLSQKIKWANTEKKTKKQGGSMINNSRIHIISIKYVIKNVQIYMCCTMANGYKI